MCTLQFDRKTQCIDAAYFVGLWSWLYVRLPLCNKEIEIRNSDAKKTLMQSDLYLRIPFEKYLSEHCRFLVFSARQCTKNSYEDWTPLLALNDDEKWSRKNYFEIPRWLSEIPADLPGQFSLSGQIFLHWAATILKAIVEFQNNFF